MRIEIRLPNETELNIEATRADLENMDMAGVGPTDENVVFVEPLAQLILDVSRPLLAEIRYPKEEK